MADSPGRGAWDHCLWKMTMTSGDKQLKRKARALAREHGISYTSARRKLLSASVPRAPRVFTVAHHGGGFGISTLAVGLAHAWANTGRRVLLVDTSDPDHPGAADMLSSHDATIHVEVSPVRAANGMRLDHRPLRERLDRAREDFDAVVVDWCDPHHRWDLPGDRVIVPLGGLPAEALGAPPARHRMWTWLTEEYLRFATVQPENIAYDALCQANGDWLDSLSEEEFDRWETENAPDESPQRAAFLHDVAERARLMWGQTWMDHAGQWTEWYDRMDDRCEASGLLPRTPQEAADALLSHKHMPPTNIPWARIVCVANRQEELPDHLNALVEKVRAELDRRGLRLADTVIPATDLIRRWRPVVAANAEPEPFPAQALEHFKTLAAELIH